MKRLIIIIAVLALAATAIYWYRSQKTQPNPAANTESTTINTMPQAE